MLCAGEIQFLSGAAGLVASCMLAVPFLAGQTLRDALQIIENVEPATPDDRKIRDKAQAALFNALVKRARRDYSWGKSGAITLGFAFLAQLASLALPSCQTVG
jgi:hypothetical protein